MALLKAGVDLDLRPLYGGDTEILEERYAALKPYLYSHDGDADWPTHIILHETPVVLVEISKLTGETSKSAQWIALTTWETTRLREDVVQRMEAMYSKIVVVSEFNRKAFIDSGANPQKLHVLPHCFDPEFWWTEPKRDALTIHERYRFLWINCFRDFKSPVGLLLSYLAEFREEDKTLLTMLTDKPEEAESYVKRFHHSLQLGNYAPVEILGPRLTAKCHDCNNTGMKPWPNDGEECQTCKGKGWIREFHWLPEKRIRQLHYDSDCYVTCTRGEGWGLGSFEAAIIGNPVIATGFSGMKDYLDVYSNTYYVNYFLFPCVAEPEEAIIHGVRGDQEMAEADLGHLRRLMRQAYKDGWGRTPYWTDHQDRFRQRFSQEAVGEQFKKILEDM